jgi:hypothetical protein
MKRKSTLTPYGFKVITRFDNGRYVSTARNKGVLIYQRIQVENSPSDAKLVDEHAKAVREFYRNYKTASLTKLRINHVVEKTN